MKRYHLDLRNLWKDLFDKHVVIAYAAGVYWRERFPHIDSKEPYPFYQAIVRELLDNHRGIADPRYAFYASPNPRLNFQVADRFRLVDIPIPMARAFAPGSVWHRGKCIHPGRFEGNLRLCVSKSKPKPVVSLLELRERDEFYYKNMLPWLDQGISGGMARYTLSNTRLFELKGLDSESGKPVVCYIPMMELARYLFMRSSFMNISLFDSSLVAEEDELNPNRFRELEREEIEREAPGYDPDIPIFWMYRNFADSDAFVLERLWKDPSWRKAAFSIASSVGEDRSNAIRFINMFWPWEGDGSVHFVLSAAQLKEDGSAWIAPRILEVEEYPPYDYEFELWTAETGKRPYPDKEKEKHVVESEREQRKTRHSSSLPNQDEVSDEMNMEEQPHNESLPLPVELEDPDALQIRELKKRKVKGRNAKLFERRSEEISEGSRKRSLSPHVPQGMDDGEKPHPASVRWSDVKHINRTIELAKGVAEAAKKSGAIVRFASGVDHGTFVLKTADEFTLQDPRKLAQYALIPMSRSTKNVHGKRCKVGSYGTARPRLVALYVMESMEMCVIVFMPLACDQRSFPVRIGLTNGPWNESDIRHFLQSFCRKDSQIDAVMVDVFPEGHDRINFFGEVVSDRLEAKLLARLGEHGTRKKGGEYDF